MKPRKHNGYSTIGTENIIPTKVGIHSQTVEIYNLTGKLIKSFPLGETEKELNISDLESGIYLVKVGEQMQKLVVE